MIVKATFIEEYVMSLAPASVESVTAIFFTYYFRRLLTSRSCWRSSDAFFAESAVCFTFHRPVSPASM